MSRWLVSVDTHFKLFTGLPFQSFTVCSVNVMWVNEAPTTMGMTLPCLPGVGLVDVDDIAQPQRWNTGVEQFLLWLGQKTNTWQKDKNRAVINIESLRDSYGFVNFLCKYFNLKLRTLCLWQELSRIPHLMQLSEISPRFQKKPTQVPHVIKQLK